MKPSEKFDFLMNLTDTQNHVLGKHLSFDASYISRIRSGKRVFPKGTSFAEDISRYFAENLTEYYQKQVLSDFFLEGIDWPEDKTEIQQLLFRWLTSEEYECIFPIEKMLSVISTAEPAVIPRIDINTDSAPFSHENTKFFYGTSGKRNAFTEFLSDLTAMDNPPPLLLYSSEELSWIFENPEFSKKWDLLLLKYIKKGGKITIIHTVSRSEGELLMELQKWIPLYLTGAVDPYYYPNLPDKFFRKSFFIAKGHSAIIASSVGKDTQNSFNCRINDKSAVLSLENEYSSFFGLCKPLINIFTFSSKDKFANLLRKFNSAKESTVTVRTTPSFYTMPENVAERMSKRPDGECILKRQAEGRKTFEEMAQNNIPLTEILNLPDPKTLKSGKIPFPMCDLFRNTKIYYTAEELKEHIYSVIEKLRNNSNYNVVLSSKIPANELIYAKRDSGILLVKSNSPSVAFDIDEQRIKFAFWYYLSDITENSVSKEITVQMLNQYAESLPQTE